LRYWKYAFDKETRPTAVLKRSAAPAQPADLVEVRPVIVPGSMFEFTEHRGAVEQLELGSERKLRIPTQFEAAALERLLAVLERR
jgi:hypothetical protein